MVISYCINLTLLLIIIRLLIADLFLTPNDFSCTRPSEEDLLLVQIKIFHEEKSLNPFYSHSIKFDGHKKMG